MKLPAVIACLAAVWPMGAYADRCRTEMPVTVAVQPSASLNVTPRSAPVTLTRSDIERGRKTLSVRYRISGRSAEGFLLHIDPRVGITKSMTIRGLPGLVVVGDQPVSVVLGPHPGQGERDLEVEWTLAPNAAAGTYPLPLRLSLTPIATD